MKNKSFFNHQILFLFAIQLVFFISCTKKSLSTTENNKNHTLSIYSPHPEDLIEYIVREFRQRTGINVFVVQAGTGELIERMKDKKESEQFDVFWGGGVESLETVIHFFDPFIPEENNSISQTYKAQHSYWSPFSVLPAVIIYNKTLIPEELWPRSWQDLLEPQFKNRLIIGDPERSGSSFTILATMLYTMRTNYSHPFSGWDYVIQLLDQLGKDGVAPGSSLVFGSVAAGDYYAGVTFENFALALEKTGSNVGYCYPLEGTSALPDGVALLKNAPNPEKAKAFINYVLGVDVQKLLFARWQRRSVRIDIENLSPPIKDYLIRYPVSEAASSRDSILNQWVQVKSFIQNP